MRIYLIILFGLLIIGCSTEANKDSKTESILKDVITSEWIMGERIDGPANIRDTINGEVIFKLYDNIIVECTPPNNGWHRIAVVPSNSAEDYDENFLKKGTKILVGDKVVGETIIDAEVTLGLIGYTHTNNIKPETIIENALMSHIKRMGAARSTKDFQTIITKFQLEKDDQFDGFVVYSNYENWIEDPSPMHRMGLVFQQDKLVAILHSRPLEINGTIDNKLDRGFDCLTYNDIENTKEIVEMFNHFVNSVD